VGKSAATEVAALWIVLAEYGLLAGAVGQGGFYKCLIPRVPMWIVLILGLPPWLTTYTLFFFNVPPFGPRPFRYALISAMCWYAAVALLAEVLNLFLGYAPRDHVSIIVARSLMYLGALSFVVSVRIWIALRRYETEKLV
jgi:hypothetical protein